MATVTKTIGTSSRDYSTISAWEADLNDEDIYSDGDDAVGTMYADSTFTGNTTTINGGDDIGGSGSETLGSITLTVHADSRHDGTAESGVLLKPTASSGHDVGIIRIGLEAATDVTIEWLDISLDSLDSTNTNKAIVIVRGVEQTIIRNLLIHDKGGNPGSNGPFMIHVLDSDSTASLSILNNTIYNIVETGGDSANAINVNVWQGEVKIYNNTVYNIDSAGSNKAATAYRYNGDSSQTAVVKNNIAAKMVADTASYKRAFWDTGTGGDTTEDYNLSDDTISTSTYKATGSNSLVDKTLAEINFVSTGGGTEDLRLLNSDSVCVDAGVDLGTTDGVNIDIKQRDRDSQGDTWDIGSHELVPEATAGAAFLLFVD